MFSFPLTLQNLISPVFDRCWTATANDMRRDAVDSCPVIEGDVFEEFGRAAYQMENLQ